MTQPPDPTGTVDLTEPLPPGSPFLAADQDLFLWLVGHLDRPDPFAALEARLDAALGCGRRGSGSRVPIRGLAQGRTGRMGLMMEQLTIAVDAADGLRQLAGEENMIRPAATVG